MMDVFCHLLTRKVKPFQVTHQLFPEFSALFFQRCLLALFTLTFAPPTVARVLDFVFAHGVPGVYGLALACCKLVRPVMMAVGPARDLGAAWSAVAKKLASLNDAKDADDLITVCATHPCRMHGGADARGRAPRR
jgi:hypothetical protein